MAARHHDAPSRGDPRQALSGGTCNDSLNAIIGDSPDDRGKGRLWRLTEFGLLAYLMKHPRQVFSREQLVEWFDLAHVSKSPARWDPEKLNWMNAEYLKRLGDTELAARLAQAKPEVFKFLESVMNPVAMTAAGRAKFQLLADHERFLMAMAEPGHPDPAAREHLGEAGQGVLRDLVPKLKALPDWSAPSVSGILKETIKALGVKPPQVMMPFRVAVTGQLQTPAIDAIAAALRKEVVLQRLERALAG